MKRFGKILWISILFIIYIYVCNISFLPDSIIIFEGESIDFKTVAGISVNRKERKSYSVIQASKNIKQTNTYDTAGLFEVNLDLFGTIPVKEIDVNVIPKTKVIPMGNIIGIKMYTAGVLVVGMSEIEGEDNNYYKPYLDSGLKEGDMITEMNDTAINNTNDLIDVVNNSQGKSIEIKYLRDEKEDTTSIIPVKTSEYDYKIGLWVRDAAAGVGTLSFYEPSSGSFAALGHGIIDVDTSKLLNIANGELVNGNIVSINKGEKDIPGEIRGSIDGMESIGYISKNTDFGVFGRINSISSLSTEGKEEYDVALRSEIKTGEAEVICSLENGKIEKYKIKIEKIYTSNNYDNKSMLIKIDDERLIDKTGGIIQGMSGSPIIQNGKFIGAVTNVLVSDPTQGYAVFGDLMIKKMKEVE